MSGVRLVGHLGELRHAVGREPDGVLRRQELLDGVALVLGGELGAHEPPDLVLGVRVGDRERFGAGRPREGRGGDLVAARPVLGVLDAGEFVVFALFARARGDDERRSPPAAPRRRRRACRPCGPPSSCGGGGAGAALGRRGLLDQRERVHPVRAHARARRAVGVERAARPSCRPTGRARAATGASVLDDLERRVDLRALAVGLVEPDAGPVRAGAEVVRVRAARDVDERRAGPALARRSLHGWLSALLVLGVDGLLGLLVGVEPELDELPVALVLAAAEQRAERAGSRCSSRRASTGATAGPRGRAARGRRRGRGSAACAVQRGGVARRSRAWSRRSRRRRAPSCRRRRRAGRGSERELRRLGDHGRRPARRRTFVGESVQIAAESAKYASCES